MISNSQKLGSYCVEIFSRRSLSGRKGSQFSGKVALITGSNDGIGLATARRLGLEGAKVVISGRKQENVERALEDLKADGISADGLVCHIGRDADRRKVFDFASEKYGGIDMLFQNAGLNSFLGKFLETPEEQFDKMFAINVKSNFHFVRDAIPHMKHRKGASIVLHSSVSGYLADTFPVSYAVSQGAIINLMRGLLPDVSKHNIRLNTICPGIIKTRFGVAAFEKKDVLDMYHTRAPRKRIGTAEEVSGVVSYLFSERSSYVTGEVFHNKISYK